MKKNTPCPCSKSFASAIYAQYIPLTAPTVQTQQQQQWSWKNAQWRAEALSGLVLHCAFLLQTSNKRSPPSGGAHRPQETKHGREEYAVPHPRSCNSPVENPQTTPKPVPFQGKVPCPTWMWRPSTHILSDFCFFGSVLWQTVICPFGSIEHWNGLNVCCWQFRKNSSQ